MIETLKRLPADKIPPCAIYSELVAMTGLRNGWTIKQWINYLKKGD
jgi:hypothetical protein